jgi:hypothetical protein
MLLALRVRCRRPYPDRPRAPPPAAHREDELCSESLRFPPAIPSFGGCRSEPIGYAWSLFPRSGSSPLSKVWIRLDAESGPARCVIDPGVQALRCWTQTSAREWADDRKRNAGTLHVATWKASARSALDHAKTRQPPDRGPELPASGSFADRLGAGPRSRRAFGYFRNSGRSSHLSAPGVPMLAAVKTWPGMMVFFGYGFPFSRFARTMTTSLE